MKKHYLIFFCIIVILIIGIVFGTNYSLNLSSPKTTYVHHFPENKSPALTEFMSSFLRGHLENRPLETDNRYVFSIGNLQQGSESINYYEYTEAQIEKYYEPLLGLQKPDKQFRQLKESEELETSVYKPVKDIFSFNLPKVALERGNRLKIQTESAEEILDLPQLMEKYNIKETDEIAFDVVQSNKGYFTLLILDEDAMNSKGQKLYLTFFIKQDLSKMVMSESFDEAVQEKLDKGDLNSFFSDFQKIDDAERYGFLYDQTIVDMKIKKIVEIKKEDYLSNDGRYVYINGRQDKLEDGIQKIQRIENYAAGNEIYETEFKLDYKEIAKELDLVISGIGIAEINYFNKDYVVLNLEYNGKFVGTGGGTNVIIDLQENKKTPAFYLVNLELNIEIRDWLTL
ncbi:hypothetical protein [Metabacillus fastidiosus]|uniref:hypothetical protein n=1 Tax=Metabacillus fastidiosus TaxID=1458 RepID=UPI000824E002|nr:hypothetical protein [Metabacillus fastidiosus]MED4460943.1 hypothetical protein [Metabacillus fastidiosus]